MRWDDVDLHTGVWTLPKEQMKSKRAHEVPLSLLAIRIIKRCNKLGPYALTTDGVTHVRGFSKMKIEIDKTVVDLNDGNAIDPWTFHDLRRTAATNLAKLKVPPYVIGTVLGHSPQGVTAEHYVWHRFMPEKRVALRRLALHILGIMKAPPTNN